MRVTMMSNIAGILNGSQRIGKWVEEVRNRRKNEDYSDLNIKMSQNTQKSPGNQSTLRVTQTPVKAHRQTLAWKTCKK